ncbi:MAG: hypothetical protein A2Z96_04090 [Spirochaetes bacterium GWB1_48_6]|nr:MAG: hypothetical protein A2Z96_04090 [Spirochaetes bacterium GWB1_48_6]
MHLNRGFITLLFLIYLSFSGLYGQNFDFEISFKEILSEPQHIPGERIIVDTTIIDYQVLDPDPANYTLEVNLLQGEWQGSSRIQTYTAKAIFTGSEYMGKFPVRRPRGPDEFFMGINKKVLAYLEFLRIDRTETGEPILIFKGLGIRKLQ